MSAQQSKGQSKETKKEGADAPKTNPTGRHIPKGDSGRQNALAQRQREAAHSKDPSRIAPGKIHNAIISQKGIAYSKDEGEQLGVDKPKSKK